MFLGKKVIVVMPAYNAERTLLRTYQEVPKDWVDEVLLTDDASQDRTVELAQHLGVHVLVHERTQGYGANQKTCYLESLRRGADIVIMVHPDHQYDARVIPQMVQPIARGECDAVFGSRMLGGRFIEGGMPLWKFYGNVGLTALTNLIVQKYLTETHTGLRAYSSRYLEKVAFERNSDGFVFDTEIILQGIWHGLRIYEVPVDTRYFDEASQIRIIPSIWYATSILNALLRYKLHAIGLRRYQVLEAPRQRKLTTSSTFPLRLTEARGVINRGAALGISTLRREPRPEQHAPTARHRGAATKAPESRCGATSSLDMKTTRYLFKNFRYSSHWWLLRLVAGPPGLRILDVGSSTGYLAEELRRQGHEVVCVELDPVAAETARMHCDRLYQGDLMHLELKERSYFDRIVLADVLEHLPNPLQALERLNPALREDGKFIISVPNVAHVTVRLKLLMGHFEYTDRGILDRTHQRFFTRKSFHALLQAAGLRVESIWATPAPVQLDIPWTQARMFAPLHELHRLACSLFQGLLGYQFISVASVDR